GVEACELHGGDVGHDGFFDGGDEQALHDGCAVGGAFADGVEVEDGVADGYGQHFLHLEREGFADAFDAEFGHGEVAGEYTLVAHAEGDVAALEAAFCPEAAQCGGDGVHFDDVAVAGGAFGQHDFVHAFDGGVGAGGVGEFDGAHARVADVN